MIALLALPIAYLLGAIPFGYLLVRWKTGGDVRASGSGNIGATNVLRTTGRITGIATLLLDIAKGYAAVEVARWLVARPDWPIAASASGGPLQSKEFWIVLAAFVAVLGHMFPVWLRFHGGKGVATTAGAFLALDPIVVAAAVIVFILVLITTRFVSLSSILASSSIPIFFHFLAHNAPFWRVMLSIPIVIAVILKHHSNIARLVNGTERRMGERKDEH